MKKQLPISKPIGLYEAKTHFSKIVDDLVNGRCGPVPVSRHGKQAVYIFTSNALPEPPPKPKSIIGCMKGQLRDLDLADIELTDGEIDEMFGEKRDKAVAQAIVEGCILVTHDDDIAKYGAFVRKV